MYFDHRFFLKRVVSIAVVTLFALFLGGCGTTRYSYDEELGYIMVSRGQAGIFSWLTGGVSYCKAVQSNLQGVKFQGELIYEGDTCRIAVVGGDDAPAQR